MTDNEIKVEVGNNILIFLTKSILNGISAEDIREDILKQIKSGVIVLDGRIELVVVKKEDDK